MGIKLPDTLFIHSFIADIYIVPLQVGLIRSAPKPQRDRIIIHSYTSATLVHTLPHKHRNVNVFLFIVLLHSVNISTSSGWDKALQINLGHLQVQLF